MICLGCSFLSHLNLLLCGYVESFDADGEAVDSLCKTPDSPAQGHVTKSPVMPGNHTVQACKLTHPKIKVIQLKTAAVCSELRARGSSSS